MAGETGVAKPAKKLVEARVGTADDDAARKLAEKKGIAIADVYSQAIERGLPILIEEDNKLNWWHASSAKAEIRNLLDSLPEGKLTAAIAQLEALKTS